MKYVIVLTFGNILLFTEAEKIEDSEIHRDIVSHRLKQDIVGISCRAEFCLLLSLVIFQSREG